MTKQALDEIKDFVRRNPYIAVRTFDMNGSVYLELREVDDRKDELESYLIQLSVMNKKEKRTQ